MPDDRQADAEVFVGHNIAHSAHFQPGEFRVFLLDFQRDVSCRLADDFQVTYNSIGGFIISSELLVGHRLGVSLDFLNAGQDIFNAHLPAAIR